MEYKYFIEFLDEFKGTGFKDIDPDHPLIIKLEKMTTKSNQFFYVVDFSHLNVIYSSSRSLQMIGLKPEEMNPRTILFKTHPSELIRHGVATSRAFKHANKIFSNPDEDYLVMSTNHRFMTQSGKYQHQFIQHYMMNTMNPELNVYGINVHTDISWFKKKIYGFNNYIGKDLSNFKLPHEKLIMDGCIFSKSEFNVLKLVKEGLSSDQIAKELFVSLHTIEAHRRNILKKTDHINIRDLIIDLLDRGVL